MSFLIPPGLSPAAFLVAFLIATNLVAFGGWKLTANNLTHTQEQLATCEATHKAFVDQTRVRGEQAEKAKKAVETNNRRIADETAHGWASALDVVRGDAARRVRQSAAAGPGSRTVPETGQAAARTDAASEVTIPAPERVIADCTEDTLKLVWLQHWIMETRSNE